MTVGLLRLDPAAESGAELLATAGVTKAAAQERVLHHLARLRTPWASGWHSTVASASGSVYG